MRIASGRARGLVVFLALLASGGGCTVGKDSVLFTTNTSVAVDVDTKPPTLSIAYTRSEAVLEPTFENNAVLPVLTSVGTQASGMSFGSNHSFATGDAALIMSDALTDSKDYDFEKELNIPRVGTEPQAPSEPRKGDQRLPAGFIRTNLDASDRERLFFGTHTNLGLAVQWSSANLPEAVSIGFKRKELAYVPLIESQFKVDGKTYTGVQLSSLIATADVGVKVGAPRDTGVRLGQLFATGKAATFLAAHGPVRQVLGQAIVPNYDEAREADFARHLEGESKTTAVLLLAEVFNELKRMGDEGNLEARALRAEMEALQAPVKFEFHRFDTGEDDNHKQILHETLDNTPPPSGFLGILAYRSALTHSIESLDVVLRAAPDVYTLSIEKPKDETVEQTRGRLAVERKKLRERLLVFDDEWGKSPVLVRATEFYLGVIRR